MNSSKNVFTIKDLENLTGIKAHTIRIWEKRYSILSPGRGDNNARIYDVHALQKLLNINTLNKYGYKISVISKWEEEKIPAMVRDILSTKTLSSHVVSNFKLAMINFDVASFIDTYNTLLAELSFRDIFYTCFLPLLEEIGDLWQTGTITPAHEHFISSLIKQKIAANIEKLQTEQPTKTERVYVLFLPDNEIHDIGLMFLNYELLLNGLKTVYVGESVPRESLIDTLNYFDNITFVTYFTTNPEPAMVSPYVDAVAQDLLHTGSNGLYVFGHNAKYIHAGQLGEKVKVFNDIKKFSEELQYIYA